MKNRIREEVCRTMISERYMKGKRWIWCEEAVLHRTGYVETPRKVCSKERQGHKTVIDIVRGARWKSLSIQTIWYIRNIHEGSLGHRHASGGRRIQWCFWEGRNLTFIGWSCIIMNTPLLCLKIFHIPSIPSSNAHQITTSPEELLSLTRNDKLTNMPLKIKGKGKNIDIQIDNPV